jgi:hypothetical protein
LAGGAIRADQNFRFEAAEHVSLMGCAITGNLEMAGASIGMLFAANAKVGGAVLLSAFDSEHEILRFEGKRRVSLQGIRVGGNLEMAGALVSDLDAQNADIGGSAFLRGFAGRVGPASFEALGQVYLLGSKIRGDLDVSGGMLRGQLFADNTEIGGNVWIKSWSGLPFATFAPINLSGAEIRNTLIVRGIEVRSAQPVKIDLSHSSVEVLDDENGAAWGDQVVIEMEGLQYARLVVSRAAESPSPHSLGGGADPPESARPEAPMAIAAISSPEPTAEYRRFQPRRLRPPRPLATGRRLLWRRACGDPGQA